MNLKTSFIRLHFKQTTCWAHPASVVLRSNAEINEEKTMKDERTIFLLWLQRRHWCIGLLRADNVQIMKPVRLKNTSSCNSSGLLCLSNCGRVNAWTKVTENFSLAFQNCALKHFAKAETEKLVRKKDILNVRCTNSTALKIINGCLLNLITDTTGSDSDLKGRTILMEAGYELAPAQNVDIGK